jgi:hypothetical protein
MHEPSRPAVDERQRRRHEGMLRRSEANLLGKRNAEDHPCLAVDWEAMPCRTVDECIEVGQSPKHFTGDCYCQRLIGRLQALCGLSS